MICISTISTRGTPRRGTRGRGRGRAGARAGSSASGHMPNVEAKEAPNSPMIEIGSHDRAAGDDTLSQAMLWILERVAGPNTGTVGCRSVTERLRSDQGEKSVAEYEAKIFRLSRYARGMVAIEYERCVKLAEDVKHAECQNHEKDKGRNKRVWKPSGSAIGPKEKARVDGPARGTVQPQRGFQQPLKGRGQARGGNGMSCSRGASGRGASHAEARQPALVYAARCQEDGDTPNVITGRIFLAYLMELPFGEFDVILGMDWLVKHQVNLDCTAKRVVLKTIGGDEVVMIWEHRNYLSNVISALRAEKFFRKVCEKVKNFLDVLPDDLPGLPPNREVEFEIELLPGTALILREKQLYAKFNKCDFWLHEVKAEHQSPSGLLQPVKILLWK
ncbi:uncharacterized protein LOC128295409 [Gossypium arboreum]|uniref:uncharacterized protein LOC128295409 n=1 Tax=Gossypium arboreum TaxID=29729 RepID=UPI0022F15CA5|nr:uncharacterized protein LOC128295409 [Gossypium arboreum]